MKLDKVGRDIANFLFHIFSVMGVWAVGLFQGMEHEGGIIVKSQMDALVLITALVFLCGGLAFLTEES